MTTRKYCTGASIINLIIISALLVGLGLGINYVVVNHPLQVYQNRTDALSTLQRIAEAEHAYFDGHRQYAPAFNYLFSQFSINGSLNVAGMVAADQPKVKIYYYPDGTLGVQERPDSLYSISLKAAASGVSIAADALNLQTHDWRCLNIVYDLRSINGQQTIDLSCDGIPVDS